MAKVTLNIASDLNGRVAGTVFQKNLGGLSMRREPAHINFQSPAVQRVKNNNYVCTGAWRGMSLSDLQTWQAYAIYRAISQHKTPSNKLTGQHLFLKENQMRRLASMYITGITPSIITSALQTLPPPALTLQNIFLTHGDFGFNFDQVFDNSTQWYVVKMSRPLRASQLSLYNKMKVIPVVPQNTQAQICGTEYQSIWHVAPQVGDYININVSTGFLNSNGVNFGITQRFIVTV